MSFVKKLPVKSSVIIILTATITISVLSVSIAVKKNPSNLEINLAKTPDHLTKNILSIGQNLTALKKSIGTTHSIKSESTNISQNLISEDRPSKRSPVKIKGKKTLYLKIITRPFSKIYEDPNAQRVKYERVDTFRIFYVYRTPEDTPGFYEVGTDALGNTIGFMKQDDVIEWKQYLTLKFTDNRDKRTLFFRGLKDVEYLMYNEIRPKAVQAIRQKIQESRHGVSLPDNFPVVAVEPPDYINIHHKPYLLPIIEYKQVIFDDQTTRILKVASAVKGERKPDESSEPMRPEGVYNASTNAEILDTFKIDVVFVIDTTISMQPYIDATRKVVQQMAEAISDVSESISFGLVAYRDDPQKAPGLEYRTKIFCNLEEGSDINTFLDRIAAVREATVPSVGFNEDVWAGFYTAIFDRKELKRRANASLFIIQVGDAGAHDYSGLTAFNAASIRQMAEDEAGKENHRVWIFSMHLKTPEAKEAKNISKAEVQFKTVVSRLKGHDFYYPIENGDPAEFEKLANVGVVAFIEALKEPKNEELKTETTTSEHKMEMAVKAAIQAAKLEHIGTEKTKRGKVVPPRDIRAWTLDRDLEVPEIQNMKVRLLITRNNLDTLRESLRNILRAGQTLEVSSTDFLDQLQSVMTSAMREPHLMDKGVQPGNLTLGKIGILPEFIEGLPYKTEILTLSMRRWGQKAPGKQKEFLNTLKSKIAQYEEYYKNNDIWIELNDGDKPGEHVTFLEIDRLP